MWVEVQVEQKFPNSGKFIELWIWTWYLASRVNALPTELPKRTPLTQFTYMLVPSSRTQRILYLIKTLRAVFAGLLVPTCWWILPDWFFCIAQYCLMKAKSQTQILIWILFTLFVHFLWNFSSTQKSIEIPIMKKWLLVNGNFFPNQPSSPYITLYLRIAV